MCRFRSCPAIARASGKADYGPKATLVPPPRPPRKCLRAIVDGDDEAEAKAKALAEHVARHPEDVGRTVEDFNWILSVIVRPPA
jgi:hypothetical protein